MSDVGRRDLLKLAGAAGAVGAAGGASALVGDRQGEGPIGQPERGPPEEYEDYEVHRVNADGDREFESIEAAVDAAAERDLVLVEPGVYPESIRVQDTPRLTIRGTDRNRVVLEGGEARATGVYVEAEDVVVENLTVRNYKENGVYWTGVEGYRASYVTAHNNGIYGVYALASVDGRFDNCYASGHRDAGFYIGECSPCHAVIEDVVAERNGLGYSGTNAGGALTIRNSSWRHNQGGIVPNTLESEENAPQSGSLIEGNEIRANGNSEAPAIPLNVATFGSGVVVAGGNRNRIVDNVVADHANFGVVVTPMVDDGDVWRAGNNAVRDNEVLRSGRADIALGFPEGGGNCFADNDHSSSRPDDLESRFACGSTGGLAGLLGSIPGDPWPTLVLLRGAIQGELEDYPAGDWREVEPPDDRATMPDPERPPREAVGEVQ